MSKIVLSEDSLIVLIIAIIWFLISFSYQVMNINQPDAEFLWRFGGAVFIILMTVLIIIDTKGKSQA